jgi:hypothetical protein
MKIEQATSHTVADLWSEVEPRIVAAGFLDEGAQSLTAGLYDHFQESVVLARVFVTIPYSELPHVNQQFVKEVAESANAVSELKETTPVLSLVGSYGQQDDWRDRHLSKGHIGIPIVSSSFIAAIPMLSRLLKELGVPVGWVDSHDSEMIVSAIGSTTGLFFVEDAVNAKDADGRHIIAARSFVKDHKVRSVFGIGGAYPTGEIAFIVTFCRSQFPRSIAERFLTLAAYFIGKTAALVERGMIFRD